MAAAADDHGYDIVIDGIRRHVGSNHHRHRAATRRENASDIRLLGSREGTPAIRCSRCGCVEARLHVPRKERRPDEWDPSDRAL